MSDATFYRRLTALQGAVPKVDGMGYVTKNVQGGAGFSYVRSSSKQMRNGHHVQLRECFPSPFDRQSPGITSRYTVWLGMSDGGEDGPCPFPIPKRAKPEAWCPDCEVNWFADFGEDGAAAEKYANSLAFIPYPLR
jgi:hypothetical protein